MDADPSELDFARDPYNGSVSLRAGFLPDPSTLELVVGGDVDVSYLGSGCVGYATAEPDYRLNWSGSSDELRIFFVSDDFEDATLIVNRPDGSWTCNDDAGATLDPMVVLTDPLEGQYDIWIGSYERDAWLSGELSITELDLEP